MMTTQHSEAARFLPLEHEKQRSFTILHDFPPPAIEQAWRDCLSRVEIPAHYDCPEFFLERHWTGSRHFAVLALHGSTVVGVLTGQHKGHEVISGLRSRPQICVDKGTDTTAALASLAEGLLAEAGPVKLVTAYTWSSTPLDAFESYGFRRRDLEGDILLDLTRGAEPLFNEFHASRRKNIRRAIKNGVEVSEAKTADDVHAFYQIHLRWRQTARKTISTPQIPWEVFEKRLFYRDNFRFFLARHSGRVIAAITLRFCRGGLVEFSDHNSLDEFLYLRPNDLLQWRCIEWACKEGFRYCSLGGSHTFHQRFGGVVLPIIRYRKDGTWFRQYDFQEAAMDKARSGFYKLPRAVQTAVRKILSVREQSA